MRFGPLAAALAAACQCCLAQIAPPPGGGTVDPLPHEARPLQWPQPDYFTEALKLTGFKAGATWSTSKLLLPDDPELLVLPVQAQAFAFSPAFRALFGARLDREIALRGLDANRQTDLFDADGPYVRRWADEEVGAFASAHARSRVLVPYLGRDGNGKAFVTLTLREAGRPPATAHRTLDEPVDVRAAIEAVASPLPSLLSELGLAGNTRQPAAAPAQRCEPSAWALADLPARVVAAARACHAAVVGTLLPEFDMLAPPYTRPRLANKPAWLAQAYVEADGLAPAAANALRAIVWDQLDLAATRATDLSAATEIDDPVLRPLARLLTAFARSLHLPAASRGDATERYAATAAEGLPAFASAVFAERANFERTFRRVDLCAIELALPALRHPPECDGGRRGPDRTRLASREERALLQAWRLAAAFKELRIQSRSRGDPVARGRVLASMPAPLARHPLVVRERLATEELASATGSADELARRARAVGRDFVQTIADLQRLDLTLIETALTDSPVWNRLAAPSGQNESRTLADAEQRLKTVLYVDGFSMFGPSIMKGAEAARWNVLRPGPLIAPPPPAPPAMPAWMTQTPPPPPPDQPLFAMEAGNSREDPLAPFERAVAAAPTDLDARVELALAQAKSGRSIEQARAVIDVRPADARRDSAIAESHAWAAPAHAWFFAGELEAAAHYYRKVTAIGTYSGSDLHARVRLRQIAGDAPGALAATRERLQRYDGDFGRRDLAGYEFMFGRREQAWAALEPRLAGSDEPALWSGVEVGQRLEGRSREEVVAWLARTKLGGAQRRGTTLRALYLHRYLVHDRLPSEADIALLSEFGQPDSPLVSTLGPAGLAASTLGASAVLIRMALESPPDAAALQRVRAQILRAPWHQRDTLKALYAWVAWPLVGPADPTLAWLRKARLVEGFDALLAKGVLLGLENQPEAAMLHLRAARLDLAHLGTEGMNDALRPAPYTAALMNYLLFRKTGLTVYRDEALLLARAYQRVFAFLAWPYALEALLAPDAGPRRLAACRARYLDRASMFLSLAPPAVRSPGVCPKALW